MACELDGVDRTGRGATDDRDFEMGVLSGEVAEEPHLVGGTSASATENDGNRIVVFTQENPRHSDRETSTLLEEFRIC